MVEKLALHMLPEGEESWTSMRVEYSEPLAAWIFLGKVRTGRMRYIGWMDVLLRVSCRTENKLQQAVVLPARILRRAEEK